MILVAQMPPSVRADLERLSFEADGLRREELLIPPPELAERCYAALRGAGYKAGAEPNGPILANLREGLLQCQGKPVVPRR